MLWSIVCSYLKCFHNSLVASYQIIQRTQTFKFEYLRILKTSYKHLFLVNPRYIYIYTVSQKKLAKLFLSELCQISINSNNFWQIDEKMAKIIFHINIFHLTSLMSSQYFVKQKNAKFVDNA